MAETNRGGGAGGAIIINTFTVPQGHEAEEIVAALQEITEHVMRRQPGFRRAVIHVSLNRQHVANYAEWNSAEAFGQVMRNAEVRAHMAEIDRLFPHEADIYEVISVYNADGEQM